MRARRGRTAAVERLLVALLVGVAACHAPVRTVSSEVHLSSRDWEVACSLYQALLDEQGAAYGRRVAVAIGDRMEDC